MREITGTGGEDPEVHIYWGDNDAGTTADNWDNDVNLGTQGAGGFYTDVSGLDPDTTYYYTCYPVNSGRDAWAINTGSNWRERPCIIGKFQYPLIRSEEVVI